MASYRRGTTIYKIAKRHQLSWPRVKRIIQEQEAREDR